MVSCRQPFEAKVIEDATEYFWEIDKMGVSHTLRLTLFINNNNISVHFIKKKLPIRTEACGMNIVQIYI